MVMNYLQGDTAAGFHRHGARPEARQGVSRIDDPLAVRRDPARPAHRAPAQDAAPRHQAANIFITNENKAVLLDFGAAREVLSKEGNFIRPMYTPGFAAPEMYRRDGTLGPWTDIYAIGAASTPACRAIPRTMRRSGSRRTASR
jgi:serine/threonine protein kinase